MADSYWLCRSPPHARARARSPAPADVEVVGGGITGCSCALALARAGKRVRLHEAREIAAGASGRNGGFALRGGAMAYDSAREWLGRERAAELLAPDRGATSTGWRSSAATRSGATGSLRLAADDEERDELRAEYEALREDGFAAEWRDELPEPLAGRFAGALFHPGDAVAPAGALGPAARGAAAEAGAEIREHDRVERSTRSRPRRSSSRPTATRAGCSASSRG